MIDYIENICDDLKNELTGLYENDDSDEEYRRVHELLREISRKTDDWAKE